jgi:hypothetical protein
MGRRDYRHHESKKPKKDAKKVSIATVITPQPEVEVIKKVRKPKEEEEPA